MRVRRCLCAILPFIITISYLWSLLLHKIPHILTSIVEKLPINFVITCLTNLKDLRCFWWWIRIYLHLQVLFDIWKRIHPYTCNKVFITANLALWQVQANFNFWCLDHGLLYTWTGKLTTQDWATHRFCA